MNQGRLSRREKAAVRVIYYLPGRGGRLNAGLGVELSVRGCQVLGREMSGDFQRAKFREQVSLVADDLQSQFWHDDALVVANSFGAYLFLHAQAILSPLPGKALLLSPIIGGSAAPNNGPRFSPPAADRLARLAKSGDMKVGRNIELHVGEFDWQADARRVHTFGQLLGLPVTIVPNATHMLDRTYVSGLLDRWLPFATTEP